MLVVGVLIIPPLLFILLINKVCGTGCGPVFEPGADAAKSCWGTGSFSVEPEGLVVLVSMDSCILGLLAGGSDSLLEHITTSSASGALQESHFCKSLLRLVQFWQTAKVSPFFKKISQVYKSSHVF